MAVVVDQHIEHKVDKVTGEVALKAMLDANNIAQWQLVCVVAVGATDYTVVSQRRAVRTFGS